MVLAKAEVALAAARRAAETAPAPKEAQANTTDPQSRIMKSALGWVQGYNTQAAVNEHQLVVAAEVTRRATT